MRVLWTTRRSKQSILKQITPEYSLECLMVKMKLQYFGHLMQRDDSLEKTLMLGKTEDRRRREQQRMRWLDGITDSVQLSRSVVSRSCDPMNCSTPGFPVLHYLLETAQTPVHQVSDASNHLILCFPLLLPSIFPIITVLSNELTLCIRWPKYWSFSFSISPSKEYSGLISFRIDWFDLLAV